MEPWTAVGTANLVADIRKNLSARIRSWPTEHFFTTSQAFVAQTGSGRSGWTEFWKRRESNQIGIADTSNPLYIGEEDGGGGYRFVGVIDEVGVFNRALDASEIGAIFAAGPAGKCKSSLPAPTNLQATQSSFDGKHIDLSWNYPNNAVDSFVVERQGGFGSFDTVVPSLSPDHCDQGTPRNCTYTDNTIPNEYELYNYRVSAVYNGDQSDSSNVAPAFQIKWITGMRNTLPGNVQTLCSLSSNISDDPSKNGNVIVGCFKPDATRTIAEVASLMGYDHFNWVSIIDHDPIVNFDIHGKLLSPPWFDPPRGGYEECTFIIFNTCIAPIFQVYADDLDYYWDEPTSFSGFPDYLLNHGYQNVRNSWISFDDLPYNRYLPDGEHVDFKTMLVGVRDGIGVPTNPPPPRWDPVEMLEWSSNATSETSGHIACSL